MGRPKKFSALTALTVSRVRELLNYDTETGIFTWIAARENRVSVGTSAGSLLGNGYRSIAVDRKRFMAHRLAWFYVHGEWPEGQIDHINGNRDDNRISNLRVVDNSVNQQNKRSARSDSKTGILGVHLHRPGKWQAKINVNGTKKSLGIFSSPLEAHAAYLEAKRRFHAGCAI